MKISKILLALAVAAGFVSASFAETAAPAAEPMKTEAAKPAAKKKHHRAKKAAAKAEVKPAEAAK